MAHYLRYYKELTQPDGKVVRLEIHRKGDDLGAMELGPVIQGLHLDIQGQTGDIDAPIVKTSLVMTFVDAPDHEEASSKKCGNWEEFYTSDSTYWKVLLFVKDSDVQEAQQIWGGYVTPDSFTEQLRYRGSVTVVARDNIGHMQDFPFDANGNEDGMITVYDLVNTAWAKIESPMSLNWRGEEDSALWLQCDGHDVTGAYLNVSAFKGMNWYEAMEKVLYSIGAVMRYVGANTVQVSSLRYMPYQGRASMSSLAKIEPKFIAHANRELVPAVRRIEESVKYDLVEDIQPLVSSEDFSGAVSDAAWGAYTAPVWPLINTASGNGWSNAVPSSAMYFNPRAYAIDEPPFLPVFEQAQEDIYNSMYLLCDAGQAMAEYSRGIIPAHMSFHMRLGHTIQLYGNDTSGYVIVPSLAKIYRIRYAVKVTEASVEYFLQSDGSWSQDYAELEAYNDGNDCRELNCMLNLSQFSGGMVLHLYVTGIESDAAGLAITYASVQMLSFAASEGDAYLQTNHINTANDESNNVILSHDPAFGPAYNLVVLPGIIKNGMFIKSGDGYLPAKAWAWSGGTPQQMAVYNHLQILCYHAKPNNVITGDIVNADLGNLRALYMWHGSEHLLQGGSLNFLNGRIEGAILREFARYDDMWGDVAGDSMPTTEESSSTNIEEGASSSSSTSTYESTTNVTIGGEGGGSVTVDTFLSDTSTNPVQNKAIKAYVDSMDAALEERIEALENGESGGGGVSAVIFDATCATDPWNLNELQTATTVAEIKDAIDNGSPIYMLFGNGLMSVGYASVTSDGGVDMYVYLVDAESHIVRHINVWGTASGAWYWEAYNGNYATTAYVDGKVAKLREEIAAGDDVYEFVYSNGTATADMVTGLASAIADNKLIISGGVTYKHYATQDGMIILISAPAYNIETAAFDVQLLGVNTSTNEVMTESTSVTIPSAVTESTVAGWGFTKNTGTITGIKMNGASKGTSGVVDLGTVITDISGKQDVLVSGTNIKTVNGESLLGEGNIEIESGGATPRVEMTDATAELEPNKFYIWDNMPESLDLTLGAETSGVMNRYLFQFRNPKDAVTLLTLPDDVTWSEDTELDENGMPVMEATAFYRIEIIEGLASLKKWKLSYIAFADAEVESVLMSKGIGDGIGITKKDAASVTNISTWFASNKNIVHFTELQYFTGLTSLRGDAFYGCSALEEVNLDNITEFISTRQFAYCSNLKGDFTLALNTLPSQCFRATGIDSINAPLVTTIGPSAFQDCKSLKSAIFGDALTTIEGDAFYRCSALEEVNLDNITEFISTRQFAYCSNLKGDFTLALNTLPSQCFRATSIDSINAPLATSIGAAAFQDCKSLKTAIFGDALTTIEGDALYGCSALEVVIIRAVTPPTLANARGMGGTCPIYVPDESVEAYKAATNWNTHASRIKGISEYTG